MIGDAELIVSGLGSVPDYDMPLKKISDSAVESSKFGIAFLTSSMYDSLVSGNVQKAQEYNYSYRLVNSFSADELKNLIQNMDFDYHNVDDVYFQEYISDFTGLQDNFSDGIQELADGINELQSKADEITEKFDVQPDNLTMFIKAENNPRISAAGNERLVNRNMGLLAGVIVMILFMYVISVFIIHQIQSESSVIGVLLWK